MVRLRAVVPVLAVILAVLSALPAPPIPLSHPLGVGPSEAWAQQPQQQPQHVYTREELAQLLAPIALYPDPLLSQILMASTYPIEVVEADRWMQQHPGLNDGPLDAALQDLPWDPSVKSLCHYPTILTEMDNNLTNTTNLGNAFLAQEGEVMDTVQDLRQRAQAQGALQSTPQQQVVVRERVVYIEPANPGVVYVPVYNPTVVYGPWLYPAYPPFFWYPRQSTISFGISFGSGFFVGAAVTGWAYCDWPHRVVVVDPHRTVVFNRGPAVVINRGPGWGRWEHDPHHRRGVAYRDPGVAQRYGQAPPPNPQGRRENRGFDQRWQSGPGHGPSGQPVARPFQAVPPARPQGEGHAPPPWGSRSQVPSRGNLQGQPAPSGQAVSGPGQRQGGRPGSPAAQTAPRGPAVAPAPAPAPAPPVAPPAVQMPQAQRTVPSFGGMQQRGPRDNAFTGVNRGGGEFERSASQRGSVSRGTPPAPAPGVVRGPAPAPAAAPAPGPAFQGGAPARGGLPQGGQSPGGGGQAGGSRGGFQGPGPHR